MPFRMIAQFRVALMVLALSAITSLVSPHAVGAPLGAFNLSFDDSGLPGAEDWTGTFVTDADMDIAFFNALIGDCLSPLECTFNNPTTLTFDGAVLDGFAVTPVGGGESLEVRPDGTWSTINSSDAIAARDGTYSVSMNLAVLFDIEFDDLGLPSAVDWTGMFVTADSLSDILLFTALIGECLSPIECTYDNPLAALSFDGTFLDGFIITAAGGGEELALNPDGTWSTVNPGDSMFAREGTYRVLAQAVAAPEPTTLAILGLGLAGLGLLRRRRTD